MVGTFKGIARTDGIQRLARWGFAILALAGYLTASGCGSISVNDNTPPAPPPAVNQIAPPSSPRHDLAILAVDFDPALDVQRLLRHEPVSLVVGLSNQGNQRETNLTLKAALWNTDHTQQLLYVTKNVDSIAAGNVVPVRMTTNNTPPFLSRYRLTVDLAPVPGETNTTNNTRSLDILVNDN